MKNLNELTAGHLALRDMLELLRSSSDKETRRGCIMMAEIFAKYISYQIKKMVLPKKLEAPK